MSPDIYLIAPADIDARDLHDRLRTVLARQRIAALLLPMGTQDRATYQAHVRPLVPVAQSADVAVLIEGQPDWVRQIGADGLHVGGDVEAVRSALAALKPGYIVGAGDVSSRHDAMQKAEAGADYILFGPLSGRIDGAQRELAAWWAETMQIPCVLADPEATAIDAGQCEFAGIGMGILEQTA
jgi:thiamine-phosphate pyrophosphorylase